MSGWLDGIRDRFDPLAERDRLESELAGLRGELELLDHVERTLKLNAWNAERAGEPIDIGAELADVDARRQEIRDRLRFEAEFAASRRPKYTEAEITAAYLSAWDKLAARPDAKRPSQDDAASELDDMDRRAFQRLLAEHHPDLWVRLGTLRRAQRPPPDR